MILQTGSAEYHDPCLCLCPPLETTRTSRTQDEQNVPESDIKIGFSRDFEGRSNSQTLTPAYNRILWEKGQGSFAQNENFNFHNLLWISFDRTSTKLSYKLIA